MGADLLGRLCLFADVLAGGLGLDMWRGCECGGGAVQSGDHQHRRRRNLQPMTGSGLEASGDRSIATGTNTGIANTGDNPRFLNLPSGVVLAPDQVPMPAGLVNLPRPPVDPFVGRAEALDALHAALTARGAGVVSQAVVGLGGVGKSELALQYADRHRREYRLVWWVNAEDRENVDTGLATLARQLNPGLTLVG